MHDRKKTWAEMVKERKHFLFPLTYLVFLSLVRMGQKIKEINETKTMA